MATAPVKLTGPALSRLFGQLDPDPDRAAEAYEQLRLTLTRFFDWRGVIFPDECADEALDRLTRRVGEGEAIENIRSYALGIARLVWLEQMKAASGRPQPLDDARVADLPDLRRAEPELPLQRCFDRCVDDLSDEGRMLILRYYTHEPRQRIRERERLAAELRLSANALRSRAQRLRDRLERCVRACARQTGLEAPSTAEPT